METMQETLPTFFGLSPVVTGWILFLAGVGFFLHTLYRRALLLKAGERDPRFHAPWTRIKGLLTYGFFQARQPRYLLSGILHLAIFWGFLVLALSSLDLVSRSLGLPFLRPLLGGPLGRYYTPLKDLFEFLVLAAALTAILYRAVARPERYRGSHTGEAYLVLSLIASLMITDILFEQSGLLLYPGPHTARRALFPAGLPITVLEAIRGTAFWVHLLIFFGFLNLLPLSKHFHILTALPNIAFRKLGKGSLKPARWGVEDLETLETLGVARLEDFSWKHLLDLMTCTECGRCSDNCPANAVGRPLSPKLLTLKLREHAYDRYPVFAKALPPDEENGEGSLVGKVLSRDEIWSCTTCGACEEECPVFIQYIDKIVDLRRHLIETAQGPRPFNQVFMHLEKTGNPFGKPPSKRTEWLAELQGVPVRILDEGDSVDVLFYVDSYGSYDPRVHAVTRAIATGLHRAGIDFGILGPRERDSGHQPRRMGEEGLFQVLLEGNREILGGLTFREIVTTDPHAYNTLKNDYPGGLKVRHYTEFFRDCLIEGSLGPMRQAGESEVYTFHDPCYLGRHNGIYEAPRELLGAVPGLRYVEMERSRDRSFCCGGADIILWHEIPETMRMAQRRLDMVRKAGANVVVTACPFCLIHLEDAIKTAGLEGDLRAVDLMELLQSYLEES